MIPVFYRDEMTAQIESFSPSAGKPKAVVEAWCARFPDLRVIAPGPLTPGDLAVAHDPTYVKGVLAGTRRNGFGTHSSEVARSLPYTNGAMASAARYAFENRWPAVAPVSGFHHAHYARGRGFCTFNGLVVAAQLLRRTHPHVRVGIFDADQHYGDGTDEIVGQLGLTWITHYTVGRHWVGNAERFLRELPDLLAPFRSCDVILYQAGADPHVDDPLGGWMTTEQLARRDRCVFGELQRLEVPVAWNLAGGYQQPLQRVVDIHVNTMAACRAVYGA